MELIVKEPNKQTDLQSFNFKMVIFLYVLQIPQIILIILEHKAYSTKLQTEKGSSYTNQQKPQICADSLFMQADVFT